MYNSSEYIEQCIISINQMIGRKYRNNVEVILIDDGSSDDTVIKAKKIELKYSNVKLFTKKHSGVSATRNYGLKLAKGKYVTFLDSDDLFALNFMKSFVIDIQGSPDILLYDVKGIKKDIFKDITNENDRLYLMSVILGIPNVTVQEGIASKFYKLSFLKRYNIYFNTKVVISEDTLFIFEALNKAREVLLSPVAFYFIQAEHSLNKFNSKTLDSELIYRKSMNNILLPFLKKQNKLAETISNRTKINGMCLLIHRYFGPQVLNKKIKFGEATKEIKTISIEKQYSGAFRDISLDHTFSFRYKILRKLLSKSWYSGALLVDIIFDRIKRNEWK